MISYNSLNRQNIESVTLCKKNDPDYLHFILRLIEKQKNQIKIKQMKHYLEHQVFYDIFEDAFRQIYNNEIDIQIISSNYTCEQCQHSSPDKYRPTINGAYVCWIDYNNNGIIKKINNSDPACTRYPFYSTHIIIQNKYQKNILFDGEIKNYVLNEYNNKIDPEKSLFLAWKIIESPPPIHAIGYNKVKSVLNNIFNYNFNFSIGKGGIEFEKMIKGQYQENGHIIQPLVFKIKYSNQTNPLFKVMDVYFYDNDQHTIIEVFNSWRQIEEKIQQVNDYEYLLIKSGVNGKIIKKLVTDKIWGQESLKIPSDIELIIFNDAVPNSTDLVSFFGGA